MINDFNTLFQRSWFGPFPAPGVPVGAEERPLRHGRVYDKGPFDGLKTASMWAWRMSAIPPVNRGLLGQVRLAQAPCPPGQVGYMAKDGLKCTAAPSGMISQYGQAPVPNRRTFEVGPWWGQRA